MEIALDTCRECGSERLSQVAGRIEKRDDVYFFVQPCTCYACDASNTRKWVMIEVRD
jgi:hypothetical protein